MSTFDDTMDRQGCRVHCTVTFAQEAVQKQEVTALQKLGKDVKIEGFRPGHIPEHLLREHVDGAKLLEETVHGLLPETFRTLMEEHKLRPVAQPRVEAVSREPLTLKITFIEKPEVKLNGVDKISIKKKEHKVEESDVENSVGELLKQHRTFTTVDRAAKEGDQIRMDFRGTDADGKEIDGATSENYTVVLGSKTLIPGFEDALVGLKAQEETTFTVTFPEKYPAEHLRGKEGTFHVKIHAVEEVQEKELTDTFAKELGAESVADLRKRMRDSMIHQEERIEHQRREQALFEAIKNATVVDLPEELLEEEVRSLTTEFIEQLKRQGMEVQEWLPRVGRTVEEWQKDLKEQGKNRLQTRLGLQELIAQKSIDVSDAELEAAIQELLSPLEESQQKEIASAYAKGKAAHEQLRWQKKVEKVVDELL